MTSPVPWAVTRAFRESAGGALATLVRTTGDLDVAEDAVQDAFEIALRTWPQAGVPEDPAAWIFVTARNRLRDRWRRETQRPAREAASGPAAGGSAPEPRAVADDLLRLLFTCGHPAIGPAAQVCLMLRLVCQLPTATIARLLLEPDTTTGQRLSRAKAKIRTAGIPFTVPEEDQLPTRLPVVLKAIELLFTIGYSPQAGPVVDADACVEALRLAAMTVELLHDQPEARGLLALLLLQDSRRVTRADADGAVVLLADQDRDRWDRGRIEEGMAQLRRAEAYRRLGPYQLQAAIAAAHATAADWASTDWPRIVAAYDELLAITGSPVVALNRAVAVGERDGPGAALPLLDGLAHDPALARGHRLPATRALVFERLGRRTEAVAELSRAIDLAPDGAERRHLCRRRDQLRQG
ncbi:MAG TPA: DUF6596 domain-containing protein [Egicoccus sp.]|nr:DUF6596 domain-containing protein [Egicoccus sp.]HSK21844.1 DUF6596 domain-containing protein [Egicoccus sp.]